MFFDLDQNQLSKIHSATNLRLPVVPAHSVVTPLEIHQVIEYTIRHGYLRSHSFLSAISMNLSNSWDFVSHNMIVSW